MDLSNPYRSRSGALFTSPTRPQFSAPRKREVSAVLTAHAENLFRKPIWVTEKAFLTEAYTLLGELHAAQDQVLKGEAARDGAVFRSAVLRHSLTLAADRHEQDAQGARTRSLAHEGGASSARRERTTVDNRRAEFQRLAAIDRHTQAEAALEYAKVEQEAARAMVATWATAGHFAQAAGHDAGAQELSQQVRPERAERENLRGRHDTHAAALRELLESEAAVHDVRAADLRVAEADLRELVRQLDLDLLGYRRELSDAEKLVAGAEALLSAHDRDMAAAHRTGVLQANETPEMALERTGRAAEATTKDAERASNNAVEHTELATALTKQSTATSGERAGLQVEATALSEADRALSARHESLATHPRLVALAEGEEKVDPWTNAARLRSALADAIRDLTGRALAHAVEAAQDERLVAGVDSTGLLPAPVATNAVADILTAAGISAQSAWSVVARDVLPAAAARAALARPDVVTGVVVQDENARSRALAVLSASPTLSHITVVTSAELSRATEGEVGVAPLPSVPLEPGLHDQQAASLYADRLRAEGTGRSDLQRDLTERAQTERGLLEQLSQFLSDHPDPNSLVLAHQAAAAMRAAVHAMNDRIEALNDESAENTKAASALHRVALKLTSEAAVHHSREGSVRGLIAAATTAVTQRAALAAAQVVAEASALSISATEVAVEIATSAIISNLVDRQAAEGQAKAPHEEATRVVRLDHSADPDPSALAELRAEGLTVVRARYLRLREQWTTTASTSVLETQLSHELEQAKNARVRAEQVLSRYTGNSAEIRDNARALAAGTSVEHCENERFTAEAEVENQIAAVTSAKSEVDRRAAAKSNTSDRPGPESVEYTTAEEAEARAEMLGSESEVLSSRESELRNLSAAEKVVADQRDAEAGSLRDLAEHLLAGPTPPDTPEFDGDLDGARQLERTARAAQEDTERQRTSAHDARSALARDASQLANRPAYQSLSLSVRERLGEGDPNTLGTKATEYASGVEVRLDRLTELLEQVALDEARVTTVAAGHVRALLSSIAGAARASLLPAGLGEMSGHQFLTIRFSQPTDEELTSRVRQEILAQLDRAKGDLKSLPGGESVLRAAVHSSVGVAEFKVQVLKPNEHLIAQQVPVVDVARFSDGEKLTTCVLLFCAFARMRQRGSAVGTATGTLMLDNPFGQASAAQLVGLQLAVAKAQKVHLVYATGLEDMGALAQFRQLIRMRNRKPVDGIGGFVEHESDGGRRGEVTGVSVTRPDAPTPAGFGTSPVAERTGREQISPAVVR